MKKTLAFLGLLTTVLTADIPGADAPAERRWEFEFANFFRDGTVPLYVYAREQNGEWVSAVGSSRDPKRLGGKTYNTSYYYGDLSAVPLRDGKMKGRVVMHVTPDNWVPSDHKPYTIEFDIEADATADGKMTGTYKVTAVNSADVGAQLFKTRSGAITAATKPTKQPELPPQVTFDLKLQGALIGGKPEFGDRCMAIRIGMDGDQLASVQYGSVSQKKEVFGMTGVDHATDTLRRSANGVTGKITIPTKTLDMEPVVYAFDLDVRFLDGLTIGTYKMNATVEGKPPVLLNGSFDGTWSAGVAVAKKPDTRPWWTPVKNFTPVQPGEHPRLLFRKSDIAALRKRAETPEGKAIVARLRLLLNGKDGETMPTAFSASAKAYDGKGVKDDDGDTVGKGGIGAYTISHAAGYGLLYQLTGDKKYAELGKQCFEKAFEGVRDRDDRYAWKMPGGALRAGPTLGWYAVGFDLCYDGWDPATRERIGKAIENYNEGREHRDAGANVDMEALVRGTMPPGSNHFGMQVGGAAMALLAVMDEPWADNARIKKSLTISEASMVRNLTEGFGDGGFFAEGDGTGSMSSHMAFLAALQAWRNVLGRDYANVERPNARMTALKWIYLTVVRGGHPDFWPIRGAYGHNVWSRGGLSGSGYFATGFGAITDEQKAGMKWYYNHFMMEPDTKAGGPYDTICPYPHIAINAFVNWPFDMPERNPAEVLPLGYRDSKCGFYAWRNRWQDENDIVISVLLSATEGYMGAKPDGALQIAAFGKKFKWGKIGGTTKYWTMSPRGETSVLTVSDGTSLAVDLTKSAVDGAMLVMTGKAEGQQVKLGTSDLTFKFLTAGAEPQVTVDGDKARVGKQTVSLKDGNLVLEVVSTK